jgi:ketosteroid isomerase-like protein
MIADARTLDDPMAVVQRLRDATNRHDLDALVACFAADYVSEIPAHPSRSFRGSDQVRRNWAQILGAVPDLHSTLVRSSVSGDVAWAEWEWTGTRRDGTPHLMRGATILGLGGDRIAWARFYMEPVVDDAVPIGEAVHAVVGDGPKTDGALR